MTSEILKALQSALEGLESSGPVGESEIAEAEKALGVVFPVSYRVFLKTYGASLGRAPYEMAGLPPPSNGSRTPLFSNVVQLTLSARKSSRGTLPSSYIEFSSDGADEAYCIDTSTTNINGESPVVVWGPHRSGEVAPSFAEFVLKAVREGAV